MYKRGYKRFKFFDFVNQTKNTLRHGTFNKSKMFFKSIYIFLVFPLNL